jgi:MFS family permease
VTQSADPPFEGDPPLRDKPDRAAFATVWLTLFLDLVGFGIIIPVLPFYAEHFGASPGTVTLLASTFSLMQFLMAPVLGRTSDRYGRRRVMLISIAGACVGLATLGLAQSLWMVFLARVVSGASSANVPTAQAYVADQVAPAHRAKYMGMMGAAIGLGFIFGPAIGGVLSDPALPQLPFWFAAGLAAVNFGLAYRFLPETRPRRTPDAGLRRRPGLLALPQAIRAGAGRGLGGLLLVNFTFYLAFSAMESTFALLMEAELSWTARETGYLFTGVGVVIVVTQGVLVGRMVRWIGEKRTLITGFVVLTFGLLRTGTSSSTLGMVVGSSGIACGNGFVNPSVSALVSRLSSPDTQGLNLGLASSAAASARILGPVGAGIVFETFGPGVPMQVAAVLTALAAVATLVAVRSPDPEAGATAAKS